VAPASAISRIVIFCQLVRDRPLVSASMFRELMHVDHVRDAAQPMQHAQRGPSLEAVLRRHEEHQDQREQDDSFVAASTPLQRVRESAESVPCDRHELRRGPRE